MNIQLMLKVLSGLLLFAILSLVPVDRLYAAQKTNVKERENAPAIEETVLGMNVSGNKELPNVLYIIPWKGDEGNRQPPKIFRLVDEIYSPVDPEVFSKQVNFYYQLTEKNATKSLNKATIKK